MAEEPEYDPLDAAGKASEILYNIASASDMMDVRGLGKPISDKFKEMREITIDILHHYLSEEKRLIDQPEESD